MLLQKREENSIELAATADKGKVIDKPKFGGKVSPNSIMILLLALILGAGLPALVLYLLQFLKYKIEGPDDIAKITKLPLVAEVAVASESAKTAAGIVVHENQNDQIDEIFRSMRTNIQFMMTDKQKVILFSSTTSGEGKTFNAANLAVSFALLGKKVILLGLDIRKPALGRLFNVGSRDVGITNLLNKENVTMADVNAQVIPSGINKNLDLLLAGPVPPNPAELLARENLGVIFNYLKEEFRTFPFCARSCDDPKATQKLSKLIRHGIVSSYALCVEQKKGCVAQFEHTVYIAGKKGEITTYCDGGY
jgi:hypothetical protein